jgi:Flp pilus assembly protein TadG
MTTAHAWRRRGRRGRPRRLVDESGAVSPFILLLIPALAGLAGLAYDAGMMFAEKREAYNVAAAAARAGANDIDVPSLYAGDPVLAPTAVGTASAFAAGQGLNVVSARRLSDTEIEITVDQQVEMKIWGIAGIGTQTVQATATSEISDG